MSERGAQAPKVAIFGAYSDHDQYQRNRTLVNAFERLSRECVRIRPRRSGRREHGFSFGAPLFSRLLGMCRDAASLWSQRASLRDCDVIFVPYPAYLDILLLWFTGQLRGRRLIADAFLELHSTVVEDRKLLPPGSMRARALLWFQRFTLGRADIVFIDTVEQAVILNTRLKSDRGRIVAVPVGIDESLWLELPMPKKFSPLHVLFWGTFIPLHGIDVMVESIRLLNARGVPVEMTLVGDGQTASDLEATLIKDPLANLIWHRTMLDVSELAAIAERAHILLGVFSDSPKASSVIPYKVHQALALNRPVITRASPAIEPYADDRLGLFTVAPSDPELLANELEIVYERLKKGWLPATRHIYEQNFSNRRIEAIIESALSS